VGELSPDVERRYRNVREALARNGLDAAIVAGSEYTGFEGAVTYLSGFVIVHRYAYVLLPVEGDPSIVFPSEARYVGEHGTTWIEEQVFVETPGAWLRERARERGLTRVGVYGLDYVMTVRDHRALADGGPGLVPFDIEFDLARAVKSEEELASVRESVRINAEGFWIFLEGFAPGRTEAEVLAPCERYFVEQGCGRLTMDMVLVGENGSAEPEFRIASKERRIRETDVVLPSLEIAGPGGHWVEVSRAIAAGGLSEDTRRMLEAYEEYFEVARTAMRPGASAHDVHRAVSRGFVERGYRLGHVTGHSIGMTMIEACLYMQDTWLVTADGGEPLAGLPMRIFDASESRP
jgi:Xaa-Pro aminopeptidase